MIKKSEAARKLKQLRERTGMSVRQLADQIGRPTSSYAFYEDNYRKSFLPIDLVRQLVPILTPYAIEVSEIMQLAGIVKGDALLEHKSNKETHSDKHDGTDPPSKYTSILELDVRAAAGSGLIPDGNQPEGILGEWKIPTNLLSVYTTAATSTLRIITVYGDSMIPDFMPGARVLVDTNDQRPSPPGVFILWDGYGLVLKRLEIIPYSDPGLVRLISTNPHYGCYEQPLADITINGRVIGKWHWT